MADPDIDVITKELRNEARMWDEQAQKMGNAHHAVEGMRLTRIEAGLFQVIFTAYHDAINHISQRSREGQQCMGDIADALRENAKIYDRGEDEVTHSVTGAY